MSGIDDVLARLSRARSNPPRITPVRISAGRDPQSQRVAREQARLARTQARIDIRRQVSAMLRKS